MNLPRAAATHAAVAALVRRTYARTGIWTSGHGRKEKKTTPTSKSPAKH